MGKDIRQDEHGAAAVELAFLLPVLVLLLAGIIDLGRAIWLHQAATKATRDAVRFLTRVPDPWSNPAAEAEAGNLARTGGLAGGTALLAPGIAATFSYPIRPAAGLSGSNRLVTGLVTFDYEPLIGFGLIPAVTLTAGHSERYVGE